MKKLHPYHLAVLKWEISTFRNNIFYFAIKRSMFDSINTQIHILEKNIAPQPIYGDEKCYGIESTLRKCQIGGCVDS